MSFCPACFRRDTDPDMKDILFFQGEKWCPHCSNIKKTESLNRFVHKPSPGCIIDTNYNDALSAWIDCFEMKPKRRISIKKAKSEVQRAWTNWNGDKTCDQAMFVFFNWLQLYRPYFLTFRSKSSEWQQVHSWLVQYENCKQNWS